MYDIKNTNRPGKTGLPISRIKTPLLFILIILILIPAVLLIQRKGAEALATHKATTLPAPSISPSSELFPIGCSLLPQATEKGNALYSSAPDGTLLKYTIDPQLQNDMQSYLDAAHTPYSIFIAIEPSTGRVLAINASSTDSQHWGLDAAYRLFPMASLFKIVTASAALERSLINPVTEISYRGRHVSENPNNWDTSRKGGHTTNVTEAMGKSINPVYGKIASDIVGRNAMMATCSTFGFNRQLFREIPVQPSTANILDSKNAIRLSGSGLDHNLKVSPLHAAAIISAIGNRGAMLSPRIIESVTVNGKETKTRDAVGLGSIVTPRVAEELSGMLSTAVATGTSARAFRIYDGRKLTSVMKVAAKTGTINGDDPAGQYTWFAGYAPVEKPRIAVLALVINNGRWKIKASNVGAHALTEYFSKDIEHVAVPAVKSAPLKKDSRTKVRKKNRVKSGHPQAARKKTARSSHRETKG